MKTSSDTSRKLCRGIPNMRRTLMWVLLGSLFPGPLACAQGDTAGLPSQDVVSGELGSELDQFLRRYGRYGFSGAALVAKEDEVILHKAYGLADRERTIPNRVDTLFDIGSVTKQFTAAAILHLEMQGRLSTSDPLGKHLGAFPPEKAEATIHHLLTHTAGFPVRDASVTRARRGAFVEAMKKTPISSDPGKRFRYSNAGYSLLAAIVEQVSGQSWESYLKEHLFRPAGMTQTRFAWEPEEEVARVARGYVGGRRLWLPVVLWPAWHRPVLWVFGPLLQRSVEGLRAAPPRSDRQRGWGVIGAAGVYTTVGDLYKWERALRGTAILSAAAKKKLFTPYAGNYAYGWQVSKTGRGTTLIHHSGTTASFESQFLRYVDEDVVAIFVVNNRMGWRVPIWKGIEHVVFGGHAPWPLLILVLAVLWFVGLLRMRRIRKPVLGWRREPSTRRSFVPLEQEQLRGA